MFLRHFRFILPQDGEAVLVLHLWISRGVHIITTLCCDIKCHWHCHGPASPCCGEIDLKRRRSIGIHLDLFSRPGEVHIYPFLTFLASSERVLSGELAGNYFFPLENPERSQGSQVWTGTHMTLYLFLLISLIFGWNRQEEIEILIFITSLILPI